jgi:hypothetical protein
MVIYFERGFLSSALLDLSKSALSSDCVQHLRKLALEFGGLSRNLTFQLSWSQTSVQNLLKEKEQKNLTKTQNKAIKRSLYRCNTHGARLLFTSTVQSDDPNLWHPAHVLLTIPSCTQSCLQADCTWTFFVCLRVTRPGSKTTTQLLIRAVNRISVKSNCIHLPQHDPGVDSASNRNEYHEYFLQHKGYLCVGLTTLPPSITDCLEIPGASTSWNPNDVSRPVMGSAHVETRPEQRLSWLRIFVVLLRPQRQILGQIIS